MVLVIFGALVFLFPVAAYFLYLAMLNSREHPTLMPGPWDFVGVLLANSGFLLAGGPAILSAFYTNWRTSLLHGQIPSFSRGGGDTWFYAMTAWVIYLAFVVGAAIYYCKKRRNATVIYNIDTTLLNEVLGQALAALQLTWTRVGNRILIGPMAVPSKTLVESEQIQAASGSLRVPSAVAEVDPPLPAELTARRSSFEVQPFPATCNATLLWEGEDESVRRDVEAELGRRLLETAAPDNPAAGWFLTISSCLFLALLLALALFIFAKMGGRR